jgi:hypothetical protein
MSEVDDSWAEKDVGLVKKLVNCRIGEKSWSIFKYPHKSEPATVARRTTRSSFISYAIERGVQLNERGHQCGLNGAKKLRKMGVLVELKKYGN